MTFEKIDNTKRECFKCHKVKETIKHHLSYSLETIVDCCRSCHKKIHDRIRKEDACPLSVKEVERLSKISNHHRYNASHRKQLTQYSKDIQPRIGFSETIEAYVQLCEDIIFNINTGTVTYNSRFKTIHGKKLFVLGD